MKNHRKFPDEPHFDPTVFGEVTTNPPPDVARIEQDRKRPEIVVHAEGATAQNAMFSVEFDGNLNRTDSLTITPPNQPPLQGHVVALAASDSSGKRVWLGNLKDCQGEVGQPSDKGCQYAIYRQAFDGSVDASVRYSYGLNYLEQDVIIQSLELPEGIDPESARIEAWSEFYQPIEPVKEEHPLAMRTDPATLKEHGYVSMMDETLNFGLMRVTAGLAFVPNQPSTDPSTSPSLPVAKSWRVYDDNGLQRYFLIETVDWLSLRSLLDHAPKQAGAVSSSAKAYASGSLPARQSAGSSKPMHMAAANSPSLTGVVLDFRIIYSALVNVNFGGLPHRTGPAVVGWTTQDYWTQYRAPYTNDWSTNLMWWNGTNAGLTLRVQNAPGEWGNTTGDNMMDSYVYPSNGGNVTVTLSGLPAGQYDFYLYGAYGYVNETNGVYNLVSNGNSYGIRYTYLVTGWNSTNTTNLWTELNWSEGVQYVRYQNVAVANGAPVTITAMPGQNVALINGMQVVAVDSSTPLTYQEISKSGMTADACCYSAGWLPAYSINSLSTDPGWLNATQYESNPWLRIDLGTTYAVGRVQYQPRESSNLNGRFLQYEIYVTETNSTLVADWGAPAASGTWTWGSPSDVKTVDFAPKRGRYVIYRCVSGNNGYANCNEAWIYSVSSGPDSDSDGIPDWQESELGTNPHLADSDSDGRSDYQEAFQDGTDPNDANSVMVSGGNGLTSLLVYTLLK